MDIGVYTWLSWIQWRLARTRFAILIVNSQQFTSGLSSTMAVHVRVCVCVCVCAVSLSPTHSYQPQQAVTSSLQLATVGHVVVDVIHRAFIIDVNDDCARALRHTAAGRLIGRINQVAFLHAPTVPSVRNAFRYAVRILYRSAAWWMVHFGS